MINPFTLQGKNILISGASSGIGKAIALHTAKMGAKLVILGRNEERLIAVLNSLEGDGHRFLVGDLKEKSYLKSISENVGKLDGVVHCAGMMKILPLKFVTDEIIDNISKINYLSPVILTRDLLKLKKINRTGSIVFITSINGGVVGSKANSIYGSTKAAITGFARSLSIDVGSQGIRINCIAPGMVESEGILNIYKTVSEDSIEKDKKKYPLKRYGKPSDIAYAAIYLLSDASEWVTGTTLVIDGGFTAQ